MLRRLRIYWKVHRIAILTFICLVMAVLSACSRATPILPDTGTTGQVIPQADQVEKGQSPDTMQVVEDTQDLSVNDIVRVSRGGEGLLDFGNRMRLRLFNDTQVVLDAISAPGDPLEVNIHMERGGFTGQLSENGGQAIFETTGGARITVLGARLFVVYDSSQQLTSVGNFDGNVQVEASGFIITLLAGYFVDWPSGQPPGRQVRIPITMEQFEQWARDEQSPLEAVERLRSAATPSPGVTPEEPTSSPTPSFTPTLTRTFTPTPAQPTSTLRPTNTPRPTNTRCVGYDCFNPFARKPSPPASSRILVIGWVFFGLVVGWLAILVDWSNLPFKNRRRK